MAINAKFPPPPHYQLVQYPGDMISMLFECPQGEVEAEADPDMDVNDNVWCLYIWDPVYTCDLLMMNTVLHIVLHTCRGVVRSPERKKKILSSIMIGIVDVKVMFWYLFDNFIYLIIVLIFIVHFVMFFIIHSFLFWESTITILLCWSSYFTILKGYIYFDMFILSTFYYFHILVQWRIACCLLMQWITAYT